MSDSTRFDGQSDELRRFGARVREIRKWRDLSVRTTADLAGLSYGFVAKVERGEKPVNNRQTLEALALALRVDPGEFTGVPEKAGRATVDSYDAANTLGDLLSGWWVGEVPDAPGRPLPEVLSGLMEFHASRNRSGKSGAGDYPTQVAKLAPLIRDLLAIAADPVVGRQALAPLLTAYHVAGSISARLRVPSMPSMAAERMKQVADLLDDQVWQSVAAWGRAHFISSTDRPRQYALAVSAADAAPPDRLETRGMSNLTAALAAAAQGKGDLAETHLSEAAALAERIEPDVSPWPAGIMQFGRTNAGIFHVSIGVELGYGPRVAEIAATVRPETISAARASAFWTDFGRGLMESRKHRDAGVDALLRAESLAPSQVYRNQFVRAAVSHALPTAHRDATGRNLRGLAWRMGLAPTG
ncbi:helix-turn-helix transcriptional regulator [Amycolatopsis sp. QT-25]|uniref:helix-turn-helix domain-containing protein n=1 Tax=Amycolatopsis sp. QT-25 TaxID=3034022 RepID=UPI0023EBCF79|nr:helix-turn-helix transcriptional regulator [Amycolatopsis sp. QT-25]WET79218.1 helix-turn-helix transcriptional regulator [Amycolatopsis sp. QT-25]